VQKTVAVCFDGVEDDALIEIARDILADAPRIEAWCAYGSAVEQFIAELAGRHHRPPHHPPPTSHQSLDAQQAESIAKHGVKLLADAGYSATPRTLGGRDAGHAIADATNPESLVVLAASHRRDVGPKSFGHVARFVIDHARGPVLVLRLLE
jgi:nucleotide-binding universal stress UspA family protein